MNLRDVLDSLIKCLLADIDTEVDVESFILLSNWHLAENILVADLAKLLVYSKPLTSWVAHGVLTYRH